MLDIHMTSSSRDHKKTRDEVLSKFSDFIKRDQFDNAPDQHQDPAPFDMARLAIRGSTARLDDGKFVQTEDAQLCDANDVNQGTIGNCMTMSSIISYVNKVGDEVLKHIIPHVDPATQKVTYEVILFNPFEKDPDKGWFTVMVPEEAAMARLDNGSVGSGDNKELWVAVLVEAFDRADAVVPDSLDQDTGNEGGLQLTPWVPMAMLAGQSVDGHTAVYTHTSNVHNKSSLKPTYEEYIGQLEQCAKDGYMIVGSVKILQEQLPSNMITNHQYSIKNVRNTVDANGVSHIEVDIINPHQGGVVFTLSGEEFFKYFDSFSVC